MKPQDVSEAKLAWMIWQALEQLNDLLWDRYEKDFVSFAFDEKDRERNQQPQTWNKSMNHLQEDSTSSENLRSIPSQIPSVGSDHISLPTYPD